VYGIVRQNDGFIRLSSERGKGTAFEIHFPRFSGETAEQSEHKEEVSAAGSETVLIVEDEAQILTLARKMLEACGYRVLTAGTPEDACLIAEKHDGDIHLLLTDVVMPVMNGRQLKAKVEGIKPGIKTLFMTGYATSIIAHRGVVEGGIDFIEKPFSLQSLTRKVREVLDS